jgi:TfoX/Sxy family transcriptional regulator of competence genes
MERMKMPTHSDEDKARFRSLVTEAPGVEVKPMFGSLGAFANGNMFAGLFGESLGVKLSPEDTAELAAIPGSGPFGPAERPMGGWTALPATMSDDDDDAAWFERARRYVATLPPKAPRKK